MLHIKERKVYELAANGEVPCSRATGKLLFPRDAVEAWLAQKGSGFIPTPEPDRPGVVLGSHDPLLDWAIRESECGLATYYDGSGDGLRRFVAGEGIVAGLHLFDADTGDWNVQAVMTHCGKANAVLMEFAWRDRGIMLARGNPHQVKGIADLARVQLAARQPGAGAEVLLDVQLRQHGIEPSGLHRALVARTETEAASAITAGDADAAFGLRSVAQQHQLDFITVTRERFDLLFDRRAWFQPPCQKLLRFLRSEAFINRAVATPGYDCTGLETVHYNCP